MSLLPSGDPNKVQKVPNVGELALLIQLMGSISAGIGDLKGLMQTINSTMTLIIDQQIAIRQEWKQFQRDTLETRALRSDIDIQNLESKDREYEAELKKIRDAQESVKLALENYKSGRGHTEEKMKAIVKGELSADKVDIRGIKLSSKQFTYVLIGLIILLGMLIVFLPDVVAQILMRMAGMISSTPTP